MKEREWGPVMGDRVMGGWGPVMGDRVMGGWGPVMGG